MVAWAESSKKLRHDAQPRAKKGNRESQQGILVESIVQSSYHGAFVLIVLGHAETATGGFVRALAPSTASGTQV